MTKILLVEDSRTINKIITTSLDTAGYNVVSCLDVDHAIDALKSCNDIRLVITDLIMPGKDGHDLIDYIHQNSLIGARPAIIAISGGSANTVNAETSVKSVEHRVEKVMVKPFTPKELFYQVEQFIN